MSILISVRKTWKYAWFSNYISKDLFEGPNALSHAAKNHEESSLVLTYENHISNSDCELKKISEYLGVNIDEKTLNQFTNTDLRGKRGDKTGSVKYKHVVDSSIESWKIESDNIFTKLCFPYCLNNYCIDYCEVAGYNP